MRKALAAQRFNSYLQPQFSVIRELAKELPVDPDATLVGPLAQLSGKVSIRPTSFMKACSDVMGNGLGSGADGPPKVLTPAGETCVALMRHVAANSDEEELSGMAAFMLRMASKLPEDQAPAAAVEARGQAMMTALEGAFTGQGRSKTASGTLDRIFRDSFAWTAEHGERESHRRVEAAFKALATEAVPTAK